jgi:hypothetical protein
MVAFLRHRPRFQRQAVSHWLAQRCEAQACSPPCTHPLGRAPQDRRDSLTFDSTRPETPQTPKAGPAGRRRPADEQAYLNRHQAAAYANCGLSLLHEATACAHCDRSSSAPSDCTGAATSTPGSSSTSLNHLKHEAALSHSSNERALTRSAVRPAEQYSSKTLPG